MSSENEDEISDLTDSDTCEMPRTVSDSASGQSEGLASAATQSELDSLSVPANVDYMPVIKANPRPEQSLKKTY